MAVDLERVPTDVIGDDLIRTYRAGVSRLDLLVRQALERGIDPHRLGTPEQQPGDATAAYRDRNLRAARLILNELEATGQRIAPATALTAYRATMLGVDRTIEREGLGGAELRGRFGGIHARAVEVLAANMTNSLTAATQRARANVEQVFSRAAALDAALQPGRSPLPDFPFIGRRLNDPWRAAALDAIGSGQVAGETRRQISQGLARRLVREGVTDATTGFVDRAGRRWSLDNYTEMVARTTTREATSRAGVARMAEHGLDLVTISSHPHAADECTPYDGETFSLTGETAGYEVLDELPPFHPNCRHVVTPAAVDLETYLEELEQAVLEEARAALGGFGLAQRSAARQTRI